ncbi:MAG: 6-phosphogluconolactonase [Candidatus Dactylopiibacterium sp.]|nr:6-phosphogluconolactonase [Candidatus Dactylopiibacterium sp.]
MKIDLQAFADTTRLDRALAQAVARALADGIDSRGNAALAVSGGRTPAGFFRELAAQELDWSRVTLTLADERRVSDDDPASNARCVAEHLLRGPAAAADFLPLHLAGEDAASLNTRLAVLPVRFDAVILGMGEDAHTASIFPDSPQRDEALAAHALDALFVEGAAPVRERITLSARRLLATRQLFLHITGERKWQVLANALVMPGPARPISHFLHYPDTLPHVFWTR